MGRSSRDDSNRAWATSHADEGDQMVDRLLEALGTYRRRCVLYHLTETHPTQLEEIARAIGVMETGRPPDEVSAELRDTLKTDLHHTTLPKLAALNVIEYDPRSETVCYQHPPPHIEEFLNLTRELDPV